MIFRNKDKKQKKHKARIQSMLAKEMQLRTIEYLPRLPKFIKFFRISFEGDLDYSYKLIVKTNLKEEVLYAQVTEILWFVRVIAFWKEDQGKWKRIYFEKVTD